MNDRINNIIQKAKNHVYGRTIMQKLNIKDFQHSREDIIKEKYVKVMSYNVNKMKIKKKWPKIINDIRSEDPDVALLQETNLTEEDGFSIEGYKEIPLAGPTGLMTLIRNTIDHQTYKEPVCFGKNIEHQIIQIFLKSKTLTLINLYRNCTQQSNAVLNTSKLFEFMEKMDNIICMGDFNAHSPLWENKSLVKLKNGEKLAYCKTANDIENALEKHNVTLLNNGEATHIDGGSIDLAFSSTNISSKITWIVSDKVLSDHFATLAYLQTEKVPPPPKEKRLNLKKTDWDQYREIMHKMIQNEIILSGDLEKDELSIINMLNIPAQKSTPPTKDNFNSNKPYKFQNSVTKNIQNSVNQHIKIYRKSKSADDKCALRILQNHASEVYYEQFNIHVGNWCESLNSSSSIGKMWNKLKELKGITPVAFHPDPQNKANELMNNFASRTKSSNLPQQIVNTQMLLKSDRMRIINDAIAQENPILDRDYNMVELKACIKNIMTAPGGDAVVHAQIYEACDLGHEYILKLLNLSKNLQKQPKKWKQAIIEAIKKTDGSDRPISLLSVLSKLNESMVLRRLEFIIGNLHQDLYAYRKGIGTQDAIAGVLQAITNKPKQQHTIAALLDFEKAFELLNKDVVLLQLTKKGITGKILGWIKSFLEDRSAQVRFQGHMSKVHVLENGTPQGSVLSAFLFNLIMDDLLSSLNLDKYLGKIKVFCYADDLVIVSSDPILDTAHSNLQSVLNRIESLSATLCLKVSLIKSKAMYFHRKDPSFHLNILASNIPWVTHEKYLGIIIDKNLNFIKQIEYTRTKCLKKLNFMKSLSSIHKGAKSNLLKLFYIAAIRSLIDYAAPALQFAAPSQLKKLEAIQNSALRIITGAPQWTSIANLLDITKLVNITDRIKQINANIVLKSKLGTSFLAEQIMEELNSRPSHKTFLSQSINTIQNASITLRDITQDIQHFTLPPWEPIPFESFTTPPPLGKKKSNPEDMLRIYTKEIEELNKQKNVIAYTDGSIKHDVPQKAGAAAIFVNEEGEILEEKLIKVSHSISSMQAELIAIASTLISAKKFQHKTLQLIIHTDSLSSIQALNNRTPTECKDILSTIQKLCLQIKNNSGLATLHYIPSHIGIPLNEHVDKSAELATNLPDSETLKIIPTLSALKSKVSTHLFNQQTKNANITTSREWFLTTSKNIELNIAKNRHSEVNLLRLILGYKSYKQITNKMHECEYCEQLNKDPLLHFTLECPYTAPLIPKEPSPQKTQENLAASAINRCIRFHPDTILMLLKTFPIPR